LSRKPMRIDQRVILLACMIETQMHVRHVVFLALACLAWLPEHFDAAVRRVLSWIGLFTAESAESDPIRLPIRPIAAAVGLTAIVATVMVCVQEDGFFATVRDRMTKVHVRRDEFPTEAVRYMEERKLVGKIVVPFNWGQYILDAFYPSLLVSFDGRYGT